MSLPFLLLIFVAFAPCSAAPLAPSDPHLFFAASDDDDVFTRKLTAARSYVPPLAANLFDAGLHPDFIMDRSSEIAGQYVPLGDQIPRLGVCYLGEDCNLSEFNMRMRFFPFSILDVMPAEPSPFFVFCLKSGCDKAAQNRKGYTGAKLPDGWRLPGLDVTIPHNRRALPYAVMLRLLRQGLTPEYVPLVKAEKPIISQARHVLQQNRVYDLFVLMDRTSVEDPIYGDFLRADVPTRRLFTTPVAENQIDHTNLTPFAREGVMMARPSETTLKFFEVMVVNLLKRPEVGERQIYNEALDLFGFKTNGKPVARILSPRQLMNVTSF